ncbi:hypothetical protein [Streptomyces xanthophaeus]
MFEREPAGPPAIDLDVPDVCGVLARDLTIWMAARDFPGRLTQHTSNF